MAENSAVRGVLLQRGFFTVFMVVVNAFSWYFPLYLFFLSGLEHMHSPSFLIVAFGVQYLAAICSAVVGTAVVKRLGSRDMLLSFWMLLGIGASALMILLEMFNGVFALVLSCLLGISLGLGFPSCLAYFGDYSAQENRGFLAGVTYFSSSLCIVFVGLLLSFASFTIGALILASWRGVGLALFLFFKPERDHHNENIVPSRTDVPYKAVFSDKSFLLYLIPWAMFCLINFIENPIVDEFFGDPVASFIPIAEFGIGSLTALAGGWISDSVGRKRVVISGFILLGVGYALLGLFPNINLSWYLYIILDGAAWGIFLLMFYMIIWAELAGNRLKDKYCLVGLLPFLVSSYTQIVLTPYARQIDISAAFSLASLFLFLAVFPILVAPETLPEKKIELKKLRKYLAKATEIRQSQG